MSARHVADWSEGLAWRRSPCAPETTARRVDAIAGGCCPRRWFLLPIGVFAVAAVWVGVHAWRDYRVLTSAKYNVVSYTVPDRAASRRRHRARRCTASIRRTRSVSYAVNEKLFGTDRAPAVGTTNGIAGDIALNAAHPAASRVGQIVVNVEQLHSDNNLRDARMRAAEPRLARLPARRTSPSPASPGMPASITDGTSYHFTMTSQLTVKKTPAAGHVGRRRAASPAAS